MNDMYTSERKMKKVTMIGINMLIFLSFLVVIMPASVQGQCTLCEGTYIIPITTALIGSKTCLDASMESIFHDEDSETCEILRREAKYICGCEEKVEEIPDVTDVENETEDEKEEEKEEQPVISGAHSEPSSVADTIPNCRDLINGIYPFPESDGESLEIHYHAELMVNNQYSQVLNDDTIGKFEDSASRLVSAGAAGCFDRRQLLSHGHNTRRSLRKLEESHDHKVHYVRFFDLREKIERK